MKRKDCFFGLHLDLHPTLEDTVLGADVKEEMIAKLIDAANPDHIAYDCKGHPGIAGYVSDIGEYNHHLVNDSLAIWRRVTKQRDVLLGIHYSGLWDDSAIRNHPDFAVINADGSLDEHATTPFGGYVDEFLIPQLSEIADNYQIDSLWLDGECWAAKYDYSGKALMEWNALTGAEAPKTADEPLYRQWKDFNRNKFEDYVAHWTGTIKEKYPEINVASNWAYTTMMPKKRVAPVDFISGDFDPFLSADRARTECRYLQNTGLPWELQSWGFDLPKTGDEAAKMPCHLMQEASIVMMHGGAYVVYFLPTRSGYINDTIIKTAGEISKFVRERQDSCFKSKPVPQVAVLHSYEDLMEKSNRVYTWWGNTLIELEGILHSLLEEHYSVDVVSEYMLEENIDRYPLIVIPNTKYMTAEFVEKLKGYAYNGGSLFLAGADCVKPFEACLGVDLGDKYEENAVVAIEGNKSLIRGEWYDISVKDAAITAYRYMGSGTTARMSYVDVRDENVSDEMKKSIIRKPASTIVSYGKGKIGAIYGPICENYFNNHHPYTRGFIMETVKKLFDKPIVTTDAPAVVDIAIRKNTKDQLCIHLANLSNMPLHERRAYVEYIPPIYDIKLEVAYPNKPNQIIEEPSGESLDFTYENGKITVIVRKLEIHTVIVIA